MKTVDVNLPHSRYPIYIGEGILSELPRLLRENKADKQLLIISNPTVWKLYGDTMRRLLPDARYMLVPDSEKAKSNEELQRIYTEMLEQHFERSATVLAFGGGVVGDLAGYVAATYLRGVKLVQIPTSLLAQVDSSIGGKTGINHPMGKNLIGAFKHPLFVLSDCSLLKTLPAEELRCGLGEVIKYGFIGNPGLFNFLEDNLQKALASDAETLNHIVYLSSQQKARVVEQDEQEKGLRMILNFGHTFGHALEAEFAFSGLRHGEAVILGMRCALHYARKRQLLQEADYRRGVALLRQVPVTFDARRINPQKLLQRMALDKKVKDGNIRLVLVSQIGSWLVEDKADEQLIRDAFTIFSAEEGKTQ